MSKFQKILSKSSNTKNILEDILTSLSETSLRLSTYKSLHKLTPSTTNSDLSDIPPRNTKQIDIIYSEIFYETFEHYKMTQSMMSFESESNVGLKSTKKSEILNRLGINLKEDVDKIISNTQFPLIYYILYNFMISIREDYQRVMNLFLNKQNDIISKCEALINDNVNNPLKTIRQQEINDNLNINKPVKSILKKQLEGINRSSFKRPFFLDPVNLEKIQEETPQDKLNNSGEITYKDKDSESDSDFGFISRANTMRKNFGKSKKLIEDEKMKFQIRESLKKSKLRKKSVVQDFMNSSSLLKKVILKFDTDEEKLDKHEKCPFIEQIEIY